VETCETRQIKHKLKIRIGYQYASWVLDSFVLGLEFLHLNSKNEIIQKGTMRKSSSERTNS